MILVLSPVHQLFFGVSIVALIMIFTVIFMVSSDAYENNDRLMRFLKK
tara:strand:+ start:8848 stop:8991 length:144 start_codon:yes stop_codon:yes gene_type:complete